MELWAWLGPTIGGGILLIVVTGLVLYSFTRKKGTGLLWVSGTWTHTWLWLLRFAARRA